MQMDKAVSVRRKLLEFVAASVRVRPSPAVISTAAPCVTALLSDEQAQLAREAAQLSHQLLDRGLLMLASISQVSSAAVCVRHCLGDRCVDAAAIGHSAASICVRV
jgi:hypothetical protein